MSKTPNQLFEDYVYYSFLYYQLDESKISDYEFDDLCQKLAGMWAQISHHDKGLTDPNALMAGTGYQMTGKWPKWVFERARSDGIEHWFLDRPYQQPDPEEAPVVDGAPVMIGQAKPILKYYSGVGSRETPEDVIVLMENLGEYLCDQGYRGRSGMAPGADMAFYRGAQRSARFAEVGFDNFLPNAWMFNRPEFGNIVPDPSANIFDATRFVDTYDQAQEIAFAARGNFEGLKRGGIELHTRNTFQVLGPTLDVPSRAVICWAIPVGKQGKFRGGTNTAIQIAKRFEVEVINLYFEADRRRMETALEEHRRKKAV